MNIRKFLFVLSAIGVPSAYCNAQHKTVSKNAVEVVAHRGDWRNHPENSLRGFLSAASLGVDMVELDLKKTKDDSIVIMHDETIDRTTNGKGKVQDYLFSDIRKFGLRNGLGRVTNNQVPTLREVMIALKGKVKVNLDKSYPYCRETFRILSETGTLAQGVFKAEVPYDSLRAKYGTLIDSIIYMPVVNLDKPNAKSIVDRYLSQMKPYGFEFVFAKDTAALLFDNKFIAAKGASVWYNSLWPSLNAGHDDDKAVEEGNTKDSWDWLIAHGAVILQTDRPAELLLYLRKRNLHK